jgi:hypothetical protein
MEGLLGDAVGPPKVHRRAGLDEAMPEGYRRSGSMGYVLLTAFNRRAAECPFRR